MKKGLLVLLLSIITLSLSAQKLRPDAFPPIADEANQPKVLNMANTVNEMRSWNKYPTYSTYVAMMEQFASQHSNICRLDTIGTSLEGRLILCVKISDNVEEDENDEPEFFYSSTMHGDEVTGYYLMLRLIDTLLNGYGTNDEYTDLINRVQIYINPLANPDGTYHGGNNTVQGSMRYNANWVDLNRNYPDPFGSAPLNAQQQENTAMINYVSQHRFALSANLHGGSEVMNYPWDSYRSSQQRHQYHDWFVEACTRFVDTCRKQSSSIFTDVNSSGVIAGGDWYVISNGRQDYMNYYHNCLEITMELSSTKTLSTTELPSYWNIQQHALVNYIKEIFSLPGTSPSNIEPIACEPTSLYPNPTRGVVHFSSPIHSNGVVTDAYGRTITHVEKGSTSMDLSSYPLGLYFLQADGHVTKIVRQ